MPKVVVIGGGPSGICAAFYAKQQNPDADVVVIRREPGFIVPCAIPYAFGLLSPEKIISKSPDNLVTSVGVKLVIDEVVEIDASSKVVKTAKGEKFPYDKLILATGSVPVMPPIPGSDLENVFPTPKSLDALSNVVKAVEKAKNVVIIGGGFAGVEIAAEVSRRGKKVSIVEMLPHCLQLAFDEEFCEKGEEHLKNHGINVYTGVKAERFVGDGAVKEVELSNGEKIPADVVIVAVGVRPNTKLATDMGLELGPFKAIKVDEHMRTSNPDVFAAGDCCEKISFITKKPSNLRLASIGAREGKVAGINAAGGDVTFPGVIGVFSTEFLGFGMGAAGFTEKAAKEEGIDVVVGNAVGFDKHPSTMPGTMQMHVKLIFRREDMKLIGGQVCGGLTAGEIANMLGFMIYKGATAEDLANMQYGTQPMLTPPPISYLVCRAAENALSEA
ncbi:MAG: FAD-dependent oxidoreductase [Candidatus Baldrarchaeia archaeon]